MKLTCRNQGGKCEAVTVKLPPRHSFLPPFFLPLWMRDSSSLFFTHKSTAPDRLFVWRMFPWLIVVKDNDQVQVVCYSALNYSYVKFHWIEHMATLVPVVAQQRGFVLSPWLVLFAKRLGKVWHSYWLWEIFKILNSATVMIIIIFLNFTLLFCGFFFLFFFKSRGNWKWAYTCNLMNDITWNPLTL